MNRKFTENDLIRYYYSEIDESERESIEKALKVDETLLNKYEALCRTFKLLDSATMGPSDTSVDIIREHSGHFSSLETS